VTVFDVLGKIETDLNSGGIKEIVTFEGRDVCPATLTQIESKSPTPIGIPHDIFTLAEITLQLVAVKY